MIYKENFDGHEPTGTTAEFVMFYADWCPHCQTAKPEVEKLKEQLGVSYGLAVKQRNKNTILSVTKTDLKIRNTIFTIATVAYVLRILQVSGLLFSIQQEYQS